MELCPLSEGLDALDRSYRIAMHEKRPELFGHPDNPCAPRPAYIPIEDLDTKFDQRSKIDREGLLRAQALSITKHPLWQVLTGFVGVEVADLSPKIRRISLTRLVHGVYELIRGELRIDSTLPEEQKQERSVFWDPVSQICITLGIAKSKLNALLKENTGMVAHELVDRQRVKDVPLRMRDDFRVHARAWRAGLSNEKFAALDPRDAKFALLKFIRAHRRENGIDRVAIAISYRIPTFARLHRACVLAHGKTPLQLELDGIAEVLREITNSESQHVQRNTENAEVPASSAASPNAPSEATIKGEGGRRAVLNFEF